MFAGLRHSIDNSTVFLHTINRLPVVKKTAEANTEKKVLVVVAVPVPLVA